MYEFIKLAVYEEFCTWWLVSLLFDDLSGHSYPFTFLMFLFYMHQIDDYSGAYNDYVFTRLLFGV